MVARTLCALALLLLIGPPAAALTVHHDLQVRLQPDEQRVSVTDTITLPADGPDEVSFGLHADLAPRSLTAGAAIRPLSEHGRARTYALRLPKGQRRVAIGYSGRLYHDLEGEEKELARGIRATRGQISEAGVYLTGASHWYPHFGEQWVTFSMQVEAPDGWHAISQGKAVDRQAYAVTWVTEAPQDQIYLIAGRFHVYTRPAGVVEAMVLLRQPEPALADRYLQATAFYIDLYGRLIGAYPYAKFALVENFWETGYGMPSFSLMGPRVIRFPFIVHTSFPHEILHNWWGNSVYPDYAAGNWSEGLTAYLADHLIKEAQGQGADYRLTVLQKYRDYAATEKEISLAQFTSRHSPATDAVGYGKAMMFFHMLRQQMGDRAFTESLQAFYRSYRDRRAAWDDLRRTMEKSTGASLEGQFEQWVRRAGAPQLAIQRAVVQREGDRHLLRATLRQTQPEGPYPLTVPLAVTLEGEPVAHIERIEMHQGTGDISLPFQKRPLRLDVDPQYDLFRKLDRAELPPALSQLFGARRVTVVLPGDAAPEQLGAYTRLAASLAQSGPRQLDQVLDRDLEQLPADREVVLLGWDNRFRNKASAQAALYGARLSSGGATIGGIRIERAGHTVVLAARHPDNAHRILVWIGADPIESVAGLARKLPHYHKYSYLAFAGSEPQNIAKGRWTLRDSPMTVYFDDRRPDAAALPREVPLAALPEGMMDGETTR